MSSIDQAVAAMSFGQAVQALKSGGKVCRSGWNGKGMWLVLAKDWNATLGGGRAMPPDWAGFAPFIAMYTADKLLVPWLASQTDVLAEDWLVVCETPVSNPNYQVTTS